MTGTQHPNPARGAGVHEETLLWVMKLGFKICVFCEADRLGKVVDRAPAAVQQLDLAHDAQGVITVNHRFSLGNPALMSAVQKIVLQR